MRRSLSSKRMSRRNVAVILAGGSGKRLDSSLPKQFLKVAGKKVIEHTLDVFQNHCRIDEIAIIANPDYLFKIESIVLKNNYTKVRKILRGGTERCYSTLSAINAYDSTDEINLILHDAVRPLVSERIISDCIDSLSHYNAVDVAIDCSDTIIQVDRLGFIRNIPERSTLKNGQTPQAFKLSVIKEAYRKALLDPDFRATDDCGVVRKYLPDEPVTVVKGEQFNMKLTYQYDLFLLDKLFQLKTVDTKSNSVTAYTREQIKNKVIVVFGGSSGIGSSIVRLCKTLINRELNGGGIFI